MMKKSKILREAKKVLAKDLYQLDKGGRQFICHAVQWVSDCENSNDLVDEINDALWPFKTVNDWLKHNSKVPKKHLNFENMMVYRHRWVDHLITRYEAKGE